MSLYRESPPLAALHPFVECLWIHSAPAASHRVLPDACIDIIFSRSRGAELVGTMTRPLLASPSSDGVIGIRFRPGLARPFVGLPAIEITDRVLPLSDAWGRRGRTLNERLRNASTPAALLSTLQAELVPPSHVSPVQRALDTLARQAGVITLADTARHAGLSERQLRRRCLEETGVTPKQLARIARFRRACARLHHEPHPAALALACGYYDQSHFIHEFAEFSGQTPARYLSVFSNTSAA